MDARKTELNVRDAAEASRKLRFELDTLRAENAMLRAAAPSLHKEARNIDYLADLRHDLQDEEFALEYLSACAKEGDETLRIGIRDVLAALHKEGAGNDEQVKSGYKGICVCGHRSGAHHESDPSCELCGCKSYRDVSAWGAAADTDRVQAREDAIEASRKLRFELDTLRAERDSVRKEALEEAAQLVGSHSVRTMQYVPLELPDLIRALAASRAGRAATDAPKEPPKP